MVLSRSSAKRIRKIKNNEVFEKNCGGLVQTTHYLRHLKFIAGVQYSMRLEELSHLVLFVFFFLRLSMCFMRFCISENVMFQLTARECQELLEFGGRPQKARDSFNLFWPCIRRNHCDVKQLSSQCGARNSQKLTG